MKSRALLSALIIVCSGLRHIVAYIRVLPAEFWRTHLDDGNGREFWGIFGSFRGKTDESRITSHSGLLPPATLCAGAFGAHFQAHFLNSLECIPKSKVGSSRIFGLSSKIGRLPWPKFDPRTEERIAIFHLPSGRYIEIPYPIQPIDLPDGAKYVKTIRRRREGACLGRANA
mgnify:CR=1 FL=1